MKLRAIEDFERGSVVIISIKTMTAKLANAGENIVVGAIAARYIKKDEVIEFHPSGSKDLVISLKKEK